MKKLCQLTLLIITTCFFVVSAEKTFASGLIFSRTLSVGSYGDDVLELQKILNSDPSTSIIGTGLGSKGKETYFFGSLTKNAVIRFQNKYYIDILAPNNLDVGTGIVGISTRAVLSKIDIALSTTTPPATIIKTSSISSSNIISSSSPLLENPNLHNLDIFLSDVTRVSTKKGVSPQAINTIVEQIKKDVSTTTNLRQTFIDKVKKGNTATKLQSPNFSFKPLSFFLNSFLTNILKPQKAFAQSSLTPFGGAVLYSYYCDCSDSWLISIEPLPPEYPGLLSYEEGSQAYLSFNIPYTDWLLGKYEQGSGICEEYVGEGCASISSDGLISPFVGSSM